MSMKAQADRRPIGRAKPLRMVGRQTPLHGSISPYVIALSQTDTSEHSKWMAALATRTKHKDTVAR